MAIRVLPQHLTITGALTFALCLVLLGAADSTQAFVGGGDYKPGEIIVKLNTDEITIEEFNRRYSSKTLDETFGSLGIYLLRPPDGTPEDTFVTRLAGKPEVVWAEQNFVAEAPEDPAAEPPAGDGRMRARSISYRRWASDPYAAEYLNLSCAAEISKGKGVTVAVLDTGAQLDHPALEANFPREVRRYDYDFVDNDAKPTDMLDVDGDGLRDRMAGHGTHVAGIVDQVAPEAKIMPLRVLNSEGYGDAYTVAKAISHAQRNEADVINLSLGTTKKSELLKELVEKAYKQGVVVVAAAGNSNTETPHYPAAGNGTVTLAEGLVAVTSVVPFVDKDGNEFEKKSWFANYGTWVDIAAPGEDIRSAFPVGKYANWSGTSMATPFISGQAALIRNVYPSLTPADIETKIHRSGQLFKNDLNDLDIDDPESPKYTGKLGTRHVDVCESLR